MSRMTRRRAAADRIVVTDSIHVIRDAADGAARCDLAIILRSRNATTNGVHHLALVIRLDRKQDDRLLVPIVRIITVTVADRISVGLVEDEAALLAFEIEDKTLVLADFLSFNTAHSETDFAALKVGCFQEL